MNGITKYCRTELSSKATSNAQKTIRFNDKIINCPKFNKTRLSFSPSTCHLPQHYSNKYSECQMHKWWFKDSQVEDVHRYARHKKGLIRYPDCRMILYLDCYTLFHIVHNLHTIKSLVNDENNKYSRMELRIFLNNPSDTQN